MAKLGAPTKYKAEFNDQVYKYCLLGATDEEIAEFLEIDVSTVNDWKLVYPDFSESIRRGKDIANSNVADRLYQRAMGFEHDSEEIKVVSMGEKNGSEIVRVPIRKVYPPDTTAAIFFLKNRRPKDWRDRQEIDHTSKGEQIKFGGIEILPPLEDSKVPTQPES